MHEGLVMPIIIGSPRSGTTLLRIMLDSHPNIAIPPETGFLILGEDLNSSGNQDFEIFFEAVTSYPKECPNWPDFGISKDEFRKRLSEIVPFSVIDGFRLFYKMYVEKFDKKIWGDKTPMYCRHIKYLNDFLPEARFVHIIRDGRDASVSLRRQWFSPGEDMRIQAKYWKDNVSIARSQGKDCRHYMEVFYEDLVHNPESILRSICSFIGIEFSESMLKFYERAPERLSEHGARYGTDENVIVSQEDRLRQQASVKFPADSSKIGIWKKDLSKEEQDVFHEVAGDLLSDLGYPIG